MLGVRCLLPGRRLVSASQAYFRGPIASLRGGCGERYRLRDGWRREAAWRPEPSASGGTMTTAGPAAQASATVNVQDVQLLSLGQRSGQTKELAAVPGLGNVTATSVTLPPSASQGSAAGPGRT
jgi:hypothetical protein